MNKQSQGWEILSVDDRFLVGPCLCKLLCRVLGLLVFLEASGGAFRVLEEVLQLALQLGQSLRNLLGIDGRKHFDAVKHILSEHIVCEILTAFFLLLFFLDWPLLLVDFLLFAFVRLVFFGFDHLNTFFLGPLSLLKDGLQVYCIGFSLSLVFALFLMICNKAVAVFDQESASIDLSLILIDDAPLWETFFSCSSFSLLGGGSFLLLTVSLGPLSLPLLDLLLLFLGGPFNPLDFLLLVFELMFLECVVFL